MLLSNIVSKLLVFDKAIQGLAPNFLLSVDTSNHRTVIIKLQQHSMSKFSFFPFTFVIYTIFP